MESHSGRFRESQIHPKFKKNMRLVYGDTRYSGVNVACLWFIENKTKNQLLPRFFLEFS